MTPMTDSPLWQEASAFAARAHRNHVRKDERTPYFSHPARVALTLAARFGVTDETVLAAALLHDVIEDTTADYDDLQERFGKEVAEIVSFLSKDARLAEPQREPAYDERLRDAPWQARLIKLADVYDNLCDAADDGARRKLLGKVERALALAAGEPALDRASATVRQLAEETKRRLGP